MSLADLGLIGNCQLSALVRRDGAIVWSCMPRFDAPPVFAQLLDDRDGGAFTIGAADGRSGVQRYLPNTNVLETTFECPDGSFRVLDFAPRFFQYERSFRPTKLLRIVEPLTGTPRIRVRCEPVLGWTREKPRKELGSHHIAFHGYDALLRLTTDAPLSYLDGEPFALSTRKHFVLAWGAPVEEPLAPLCERFLRETVKYWHQWVKSCDIPPIFQEEVIRSALALKLHCFEDTGAIVAALTTSIPEAPSSGRTWDYRYCWLRDAYYALGAFRLLGQFEEREQFLQYLLNIATSAPNLDLAPLYRIDGKTNLEEHILDDWPGYLGEKPVRIGNGAAVHKQHDVFGEMVLALAPLFLDARFREQVTPPVLDLVTRLARKAVSVAGQPDAGIWEFRSEWRPQTFSSLMCWAAADRMARIAKLHRPGDVEEFSTAARKIREELLNRAVHTTRGCFVADYGGSEVDAALLQAVTLQLLPPEDPRLHATVDAVQEDLAQDGWLKRYRTNDGFGIPAVAFMLCTFWQVEALARLGRTHEASELMERVRAVKSPLGLYAEDLEPKSQVMWGNFPQAYSHVGLIHAAFAASPALAGVRLVSGKKALPRTPPEAWEPLLRLVRHASRPLEKFLHIEAASGIVLLVAAAGALFWANSSWSNSYAQLWHTPLGIRIGDFSFERSLEWVVNDGLMVIFFFVVGMEIRREIHHGELSEWRRAALPAIAALGGMLAPAALYLAFAGSPETRSGWGVPMATDIAFAVGILTLLGKRVPAALRVLLLALAVIDDLGAIIVIAVFYSSDFSFAGLFVALIGFAGIFAMQRGGVRSKIAYVAPAFVAWAGVYATGIHPTIAGVIVGLMTPVRAWLGPEGFTTQVRQELDQLASPGSLSSNNLTQTLRRVDVARHEAMSPAEALIATLHPWVAFGIMPIFALANAGVTISSHALDLASLQVATGVFVGLVVGKPVGVLAASVLTLRLGVGKLPVGMKLRHLVVLGVVAGVGFTMALFIGQLAFTEPKLLAAAKLGILAASGAAAVLGLVLGRIFLESAESPGAAATADEAESSTAL